ncbi:hypothetical protein S1OALGB6SA_453 [Olavius algarvensis spirochete endosymbiont]|nr:MAG: hypothetical protein [Olavius algarvensis spirochete endosymbiont]VDA99385.1 hypothetical protein S1OALGB6SA_453 [Olavius algarvensis spirochete endosymbiont]
MFLAYGVRLNLSIEIIFGIYVKKELSMLHGRWRYYKSL